MMEKEKEVRRNFINSLLDMTGFDIIMFDAILRAYNILETGDNDDYKTYTANAFVSGQLYNVRLSITEIEK